MYPDSTTKRCTKCGEEKPLEQFPDAADKRDGKSSWCRRCTNNQRKQRYQNDPAHKERMKARTRNAYHTNEQYRERVKARSRGEQISPIKPARTIPIRDDPEAMRRYRERQSTRDRNRRAWYRQRGKKLRANPTQLTKLRVHGRIYAHTYRARRRENGGRFTLTEWQQLCAFYDHRCLCCGERKPLSPDHVIPVSKGGPNTINNIQPLCETCNKSKSNKTIDYRTSHVRPLSKKD